MLIEIFLDAISGVNGGKDKNTFLFISMMGKLAFIKKVAPKKERRPFYFSMRRFYMMP